MNLVIGNIAIEINTNYSKVIDFCKDRYENFLSEGRPDFELTVEFLEKVTPSEFLGVEEKDLTGFLDPSLRHSEANTEERGNRPAIIDCPEGILIYRSDFAGIVQPDKNKAKVLIKEHQITIGLDSYLRICYSFIILESHGLVLHSAGIVKDDEGYIFFGVSETGKSTISGLSQDFSTILSDEIIVIKKEQDGYHVYGSPFYGTLNYHAVNINKHVKAAFMPVKDTDVYLKKAHPITFLSKFLAAVLFFGKEPELIARVLDIANDFMDTVPFYELHFQKNSSFWEHIENLDTRSSMLDTRKSKKV